MLGLAARAELDERLVEFFRVDFFIVADNSGSGIRSERDEALLFKFTRGYS